MKKGFTQNFIIKSGILFGALFLTTSVLLNHGHAATKPDAFIVEVQPSSFDSNQAVDLTIKAVTANGDVVKDYQGDVFIEIDGIVDTADYVVPSDGLYTFLPQDQGVKLFSKGLIIKKSGTFAVKVSEIVPDINNNTIQGQKTIIVGTATPTETTQNISIVTPAQGGSEKNNIVNVIANAPDLPNAPYSVYLNDQIVTQGTTDQLGDINVYVSGAIAGQNLLQIKISNANNEIIGQSASMRFTYARIQDGIFNSLQILPSSQVKQGNKVTFNVSTSDSVSSAEIRLSNGKSAPMDRSTAGSFMKEMTIDTEGEIDISLNLISAGQAKLYTGIATLFVEKSVSIGKIRMFSDTIDKTKLNVTRETIGGSAAQYKLQYGTSDNLLEKFVTVSTNEIVIENLIIGTTYYFQITPLDSNGDPIGLASAVTPAIVGEELSCVVKGIVITDQKIGDKHYLVRTAVQNAEKYIIYRSDFESNDTSKMQKVGETTGTMFEYPFNKLAKKDEYAFYLVEAACKDGSSIMVDAAKKVKVGPVENILLFIVISLFGYCIFRLYRYSQD